jgi:hypothetical protein
VEVPGLALAGVGYGVGVDGAEAEGALVFGVLAGLSAVDDFATTGCTGTGVTGNAAEFTSVWTLGGLLDGAG